MGFTARRTPAMRRTAIGGAFVLVTLVSLSLLAWSRLAGPAPVADGPSATLDGITTEITGSEWAVLNHVINEQGGYQMPGQMMPDAPEGDEVRLGLLVTLTNTRSGTEAFSLPGEFTVTGGGYDEPVPLTADTIGTMSRLGPGAAVKGTLYFDVVAPEEGEPELPPLYLRWDRGGDEIRIPVELPGEVPDHSDH